MKSFLLFLVAAFAMLINLNCQNPPEKFGKIEPEIVASKYFEPDSSIEAAILFEFGSFNPNEFRFLNHIRYKIYKKKGLDKMILNIPVEFKGLINGYVYNYEDGKVVREKIKKDAIYKERVIGSYTIMRIAPPNAREGSVVEIEYTQDGLPDRWRFQYDIPVLWSEINIPYTQYISFKNHFVGYEPLSIVEPTRWVATDMPPFRPEPYIDSRNNYMTTMFLDISEVHIPASQTSSGYYKSYAQSWGDVYDYFWTDEGYRDRIKFDNFYLRDTVEKINSIAQSDEEKIMMALENVRKSVSWNEEIDLWPDENIRKIYLDEGVGTAADMNLLFLKLCNQLDIQCYPAIMSSRDHGIINTIFPAINRFNYIISCVKLDDKEIFIDVSDKYSLPGMLPERSINRMAFVLDETKGEWKDIQPAGKFDRMIFCNLKMDGTGKIEGNINIKHTGYASIKFRKELEDYSSEDEYLEIFEQKNKGILVMDYDRKLDGEKYGNVIETLNVELDRDVSLTGDLIFLSPILFDRTGENPFKLEKREYPVDFVTPICKSYILNIVLPDSYTVEQLPEPINIINQNRSVNYLYNVNLVNNTVQIMSKFNISKPVFSQDEYAELKRYFDLIVNKEQEQLILKKTGS